MVGDVECGVGFAEFLHVAFHGFGEFLVVGKETLGLFAGFLWGFGGDAAAVLGEEFGVAFFLAGDDVVDDGWAGGGECFVEDGAAGFADDEVVGLQEVWDAVGPAEDVEVFFCFWE